MWNELFEEVKCAFSLFKESMMQHGDALSLILILMLVIVVSVVSVVSVYSHPIVHLIVHRGGLRIIFCFISFVARST